MAVKIRKGKKIVSVRVLLDQGSQRSYFHPRVLSKLGVSADSLPTHNSTIKTFLGEQVRPMLPIDLDINICCNSFVKIPVFIDQGLDVSFDVKGLRGAIYNVSANGYRVADTFFAGRHGDSVNNIDGLLGIDSLYLMKHSRVIDCIKGSAIDTCHGFIPVGPVKTFLTPSQQEIIFGDKSQTSSPPAQS
jgi:hypothetical protein